MKNKLMLNARELLAIAIVACALLAAGGCAPKVADGTYVTPEEAVAALVAAFEQDDTAALTKVLGPGAEEHRLAPVMRSPTGLIARPSSLRTRRKTRSSRKAKA